MRKAMSLAIRAVVAFFRALCAWIVWRDRQASAGASLAKSASIKEILRPSGF